MYPTAHELELRAVDERRRRRRLLALTALLAVVPVVAAVLAGVGILRRSRGTDGIATVVVESTQDALDAYRVDDAAPAPLRAVINDQLVEFPVLETDITADIQGDIANVRVVQVFENPSSTPVNATYVFPLPHDAAVHSMTMEVGNERVRAVIDRIEAATATFEAAQEQGQAASLVTQERENVFTQRIANLVPGLPIRVEIRYAQQVPRVDGSYDLAIPLVVGPRFTPPGTGVPRPGDANTTLPTVVANRRQPNATLPSGMSSDTGRRSRTLPSGSSNAGSLPSGSSNAGSLPSGSSSASALPSGSSNAGSLPSGSSSAPALPSGSSNAPFGPWELQTTFAAMPVAGMGNDADVSQRVSVTVNLDGGAPIRRARSVTHAMTERWDGDSRVQLQLDGRVPDDRDFRFVYELGDDELSAAVQSHFERDAGYFALRVEPPRRISEEAVAAREMVFVLDTSGSMQGRPLETSKAFVVQSLRELRPTDTFRVIRFGDSATEYSERPAAATQANIEDAVLYVEGLDGGGGTMMTEGIRQALDPAIPADTVRMVVFLTDGYIGNDYEILDLIDRSIGEARLFSLGVGSAVNRFVLEEMGRRGRGFARFVRDDADTAATVEDLAERLRSPVLTDVWIDWGDLPVSQTYPERIPDVFAGHAVRVMGRYDSPATGTAMLHGRVAGHLVSLPIEVTLRPDGDTSSDVIRLVWARAAIADAMQRFDMATYGTGAAHQDAIKDEIVALGLEHGLVTRWTAFVAVSEQIVNTDVDGTAETAVPVSQVDGVGQAAYATTFGGSSAPEPATWLTLLVAGGALGASRRRRARS